MKENYSFSLRDEWEKGRLPIISGILYENGKIKWLNIDRESNRKRRIEKGSILHVNNLIEENDLYFSNITAMCTTTIVDNNIIITCGEGGQGSEGFIVVESKDKSEIKWVAFFEDSNPFENFKVINNKIIAYNNLDEKWIFDIYDPIKVRIEY